MMAARQLLLELGQRLDLSGSLALGMGNYSRLSTLNSVRFDDSRRRVMESGRY